MLTRAASYPDLIRSFRWQIPEHYNIGWDCADRHADGSGRLALIQLDAEGREEGRLSFDDLAERSSRMAVALRGLGLSPGDRVAILLGQRWETAIAHLGAWKAGLISLPLFILFGPDALQHRLRDSGTTVLITDRDNAAKIQGLDLPDLRHLLLVEDSLPDALAAADPRGFRPVRTRAEDPAIIIYTSGTTGAPKGALHAHRVLLGHLPGVELPQDFFPQPGDRFWTPADWAWIGGLFDVLLPALHHGVPVVAWRARRFEPDHALRMMAEQQIRNVFLPPTALRMLREGCDRPPPGLALRSIGSGGESLGGALLDWGRRVLGADINEFYGQTECNLVVSACASLFTTEPGAMGRAVPGHEVAVLDPETGGRCPAGEPGEIAVRAPDPVMFLGYWRNPEATAAKCRDGWLWTGDRGIMAADGMLRFLGRSDDVITSAGYRIGPTEIEDCLLSHPAVAAAAVVGVPDPVRTERIKAFVVVKPGEPPGDAALIAALQDHVRRRLAAHEVPREVAFLDRLPLTATGKILRRDLRARG